MKKGLFHLFRGGVAGMLVIWLGSSYPGGIVRAEPPAGALLRERPAPASLDSVGVCSYFREDGYRTFHSSGNVVTAEMRRMLGTSGFAFGISESGRIVTGYMDNEYQLSDTFRQPRTAGSRGKRMVFGILNSSAPTCISPDGNMVTGAGNRGLSLGFAGGSVTRGQERSERGLDAEWGITDRVSVGASMSSRYLRHPTERMITNFSVSYRF